MKFVQVVGKQHMLIVHCWKLSLEMSYVLSRKEGKLYKKAMDDIELF